MVIVTIPWQVWLMLMPLLVTYRVTFWACVLVVRLLAACTRRALRAARAPAA